MSETQGDLSQATIVDGLKCRKCGEGPVQHEVWESSCGGYEDDKYTCLGCKYVWWIEGPDS